MVAPMSIAITTSMHTPIQKLANAVTINGLILAIQSVLVPMIDLVLAFPAVLAGDQLAQGVKARRLRHSAENARTR